MQILALECSTSKGSAALLNSTKLIVEKKWEHQQSTSTNGEIVVPTIKEILKEANLKVEDIDLFAVDIGPGRFTGVRVGINTIKSFSFVTGKPILAFSSLEILAQNSIKDLGFPVLTVINAHKNMCYYSTWTIKNGILIQALGPAVIKISELEELVTVPHLCLGDGFELIIGSASKELTSNLVRTTANNFPSAYELGQLALREAGKRPLLNWNNLIPLYIRGSEAEEKLKTGELKPVVKTNLKR